MDQNTHALLFFLSMELTKGIAHYECSSGTFVSLPGVFELLSSGYTCPLTKATVSLPSGASRETVLALPLVASRASW